MNLNTFDLNLLRVFDALMRERSVTRAGARVGLSQPAVSAALGRLRHAFNDDLFVRRGAVMVPTPRAARLAGPVSAALQAIRTAFDDHLELDPAKLQRTYTLLGADFFSMLFMPQLSAAIGAAAPGVRVRLLDAARGGVAELLREGTIDVAFEHLPIVPPDISSRHLFRSCFVVVGARENAVIRRLNLENGDTIPPHAFAELAFAVYSLDGGETGCAVEALRAVGLGERAKLALPHFHATALAAMDGTHVALLPCQFAEAIADRHGLATFRVPIDIPVLDIAMYWHRHADADPQHAWLRSRVVEMIDALGFERSAERYVAAPEVVRASA